MIRRRTAVAALVFAVCGAACGTNAHVAARGAGSASSATVAPAAAPTTPTTAPTAATATTAPVAPSVTNAPSAPTATTVVEAAPTTEPASPAPATIEVDYQPQAGAKATATIEGPNGTHSKPLDSGAAIFGGLPAGTYAVSVIVDTPSGDPSVGDARQIINGHDIHVEAGDRAVVSCDDSGCTGTL